MHLQNQVTNRSANTRNGHQVVFSTNDNQVPEASEQLEDETLQQFPTQQQDFVV